nr:hypothetical protein GCM10020093_012350 [Planobispora longispora]
MILGLDGYLSASESRVTPQEAEAWSLSEEGRRFAALSSRRWCEANIAAGADEAAARAAGERVTAFYTTVPDEPPGS